MVRTVIRSVAVSGFVLLALAIAGIAFVSMPALGQLNPEEERSRFLAFVEDQLSGPGRQIRIFGIDGALSSDASIRRITIADEEGVWFEIENAAIRWTRSALFRGRLEIESLSAEAIAWPRQPQPQEAAPNPEARSFALPDLPVSVNIENVSIERLSLGEPLFGLAAELQTSGSFALGDEEFSSSLSMTRLDGPGGELNINVGFQSETSELSIDARLTEPADGVVANLLDIHERPPLTLALEGGGPTGSLRIDLSLDKERERILNGALTVEQAPTGQAFRGELQGPISELISPVYRVFFGDQSFLRLSGQALSSGGFELDQLSLESGALSVTGAARVSPDGFLSGLTVNADLTPEAGSTVLLPVPGGETRLGSGSMSLQFGDLAEVTSGRRDWNGEARFERFRSANFSSETVSILVAGETDNLADEGQRSLTFVGQARASGISGTNRGVSDALGDEIAAAFDGAWSAAQPLMLSALTIDANSFNANAAGSIEGLTFDGAVKVESTDLSVFSGVANRNLAGRASLLANGTINPVSGSFDVALDGAAQNLRLDQDALDAVLTSRTTISGRAARDENGLTLDRLALLNDDLRAFLNGTLSSTASQLDIEAELRDLALLEPDAGGGATLVAAIRQQVDQPRSINANLTIPEGRLAGRSLSQTGLSLVATQMEGDLDGTVNLTGLLGRERIEGSIDLAFTEQSRAFSEINLRAGTASIDGDVIQSLPSGLLGGSLSVDAPDIGLLAALAAVRAGGSLDGTVVLSEDGGEQTVRATGTAQNVFADALRIGQSTFDVTISDALGTPEARGTATATSIAAAGAQVRRVGIQATGDGGFTVNAEGISHSQLSSAGISAANLTADGQFQNRIISLRRANLDAGGGINLAASGTIPLQGVGLNVQAAGSVPLGIVRRFVTRPGLQLSGSIDIAAQVTGSLSSPALTGTISSSGSAIADSQTGVRLNAVSFNADIAPSAVSVRSASARVAGGGTLDIDGQVGLGAGPPADLRVTLRDVRYADGNLLVATADGDLTLAGPLASGPTLGGTITVQRADIQVPTSFGSTSGFLDVDHVAPSERVRSTFLLAQTDALQSGRSSSGAPLALNLQVNAPNQIYVRGRGVDAELGGSVTLGGTTNSIQPVGAFNLQRGRIDILGERIALDEGSITLIGDLDPFIDVLARTEGDEIDILIRVSGRISEPEITLSSQPELPQDEVLARLVFDRGLDELSPIQLGQLALAAAQLAGQSNGSALGSFRDTVGLSDLDVISDEEGNAGVRATQYLQDNVYVGVEATTAGTARTTINLDVTPSVTVRGAVDTEGASSVGLFLERDY